MKILRTIEKRTFFDETLLRHIQLKNNDEFLKIMRRAHNVDPCRLRDSSGTTLLHFAAHCGNKGCCQFLIGMGARVDAGNQFGDTPLMFAVEANEEETTRLLLEANANIFRPNTQGQCALGNALNNEDKISKIIATALLDKVTVDSLNENTEYVRRQTFHFDCPLYHFMSLENGEITRILLESGSPVDAENPRTRGTALHEAAGRLDVESVKLLLQFHADVNAKKHDGLTPMGCISRERQRDRIKQLEIVKVLMAAGAELIDRSSRTIMASSLLSGGSREMIRTLLQNPIDLDFRDKNGLTPVEYLARNDHPDVFEELRGSNFDVNARDAALRTALFCTIKSANMAVYIHANNISYAMIARTPAVVPDFVVDYLSRVEILLDNGADPHIFTEENRGQVNFTMLMGETILDELLIVMTPILFSLASLELSGQPVKPHMRDRIEKYQQFRTTFNSAKLQLEEMKQVKIDDSVTLFDFVIASDRRISLYARNKRLVFNFADAMKECGKDSYYHRKLGKRLLKITHLAEVRDKVAAFLNEILSELCNISVYNVAENVVNYLNDEEVYKMLPISN